MALGTTAALLIAGGAFSATTQAAGGQAEAKNIKKQAEYNAQIYDQQGQMIIEKKKIQDYQFNRQAASLRGSIIAGTAGKGFNLGGSPLAILIDNETQMQFDKAIGDYNLDVEANYARSGAINTRQQGIQQSRLARYKGYSNAFSTLLNTGATIGMLNISQKAGKL
jgi:hypothetical protein